MDDLILLPRPRSVVRLPGIAGSGFTSIIAPSVTQPQGYRLSITPGGIRLIAHDEAGRFYGECTLGQIARQFSGEPLFGKESPTPAFPRRTRGGGKRGDAIGLGCPCMEIEDWPDFLTRGVMLDISRDKVPGMATLLGLIDLLSTWKINQIQLYIEHTFAYRGHEAVWQNASPMTADEIRTLDMYCRERHIELVPNQNSFGHMERWLSHTKYRALAESADGADTPWGYRWDGPFSLCPTEPKSLALLSDLYDQLLPNFMSQLFNVGCDETFDIGQGRSRARAEAIGKSRVYLDFLKQVHQLVKERGRTMMFWGDIIVDSPELIGELPRPIIALDWGYEADHPFDRECEMFAESGIPFYVCPGTSSWLSISGRTDNMIANQISAAENGLQRGAIAFLNTDWGDHGHLQYLPVSYAGLAMGAAVSWCLEANRSLDLPAALDLHAFDDEQKRMGQIAFDLGNVYQACGKLMKNSSALFRILVPSSMKRNAMEGITMDGLEHAEAAIVQAISSLNQSGTDTLIKAEYANAAEMLRHACWRGMWKLEPGSRQANKLAEQMRAMIGEHRRLWLARNRPGGLDDSSRRLWESLREYE